MFAKMHYSVTTVVTSCNYIHWLMQHCHTAAGTGHSTVIQYVLVSVHTSWPPLSAGEGGGVNDEMFSLRVIGSCRLQPSHKGSMTQLGLGISADYLQLLGHGQPFGLLLWRSLRHQCWDEHLSQHGQKSSPDASGVSSEGTMPLPCNRKVRDVQHICLPCCNDVAWCKV